MGMRNGKVEYYNDFDCTEPCLAWHTSGIRNIYVVRRKYSSTNDGRIQEFRLAYGEFEYALNRYELEMNRVENAPSGFVPRGLELVIEVYSDSNKVYEDNIIFDENRITTKSIEDGDIDIYAYFKSIYVKDDSEVMVRGIIPMSSLYSVVKVDKWNDNETEIWNNLDQTLKGKF